MNKAVIIFIIVFLFFVSSAYAQPPFSPEQVNVFTAGFVIEHPSFNYYPSNSQVGLAFHVYNITNGVMMTNETIDCKAHIYNSTGYEIFSIESLGTVNGNEGEFFANSTDAGFSEGYYGWAIHCNQTDLFGGYATGNFEITESGEEEVNLDNTSGMTVMIFIFTITIFLVFLGMKHDFSQHPVANLIFKRCLILFGMFLLSFNTTIVGTIADNANLGVTTELLRYLWMVNWSIYLFMLWLGWTTLINVLRLWEDILKRKRMGEDDYT